MGPRSKALDRLRALLGSPDVDLTIPSPEGLSLVDAAQELGFPEAAQLLASEVRVCGLSQALGLVA